VTQLTRWYEKTSTDNPHPIYTRDTWTIPPQGTEIWCTAWKRGQTIQPVGDGCHIMVGFTVYHCDEFMDILTRLEGEGNQWGIVGVTMLREQDVGGRWIPVDPD